MPLFPSDFKKFKHVSSDEESTTLRHDKGHELKIAHKALSPKMRAQLEALQPKKMSEGGEAKDKEYNKKVNAQINQYLPPGMESKENGEPKSKIDTFEEKAHEAGKDIGRKLKAGPGSAGYAEGGILSSIESAAHKAGDAIKKAVGAPGVTQEDPNKQKFLRTNKAHGGECYADGGQMPQSDELQADPSTQEARKIYNQIKSGANLDPFTAAKVGSIASNDELFGPEGKEPYKFDPITWNQAREQQAKTQAENAAKTAQAQQATIAQNQVRTDAGLAPLPVPNIPQGNQPDATGQEPTAAASLAPTATADTMAGAEAPTSKIPDTTAMLGQGYNQAIQSAQMAGQAQSAQAESNQKILENNMAVQQQMQQQYQQDHDALEMERKHLVDDVQQGFIDPEKFWDNHSRIASGIGIILAGFNPTNNPNAAINYLKLQMEQNLDAQKQNLSSKQSLLSKNLEQFGNLRQAMDMTRVMQADLVSNQLATAAAKASSPLAKAAALKASADIKAMYAPLFQKVATQTATNKIMASANQDPSKIPAMIDVIAQQDPERAKDLRSRFVPGAGLANSAEDAKTLKEVESRRKNIHDNAKAVLDIIKKKGTFEMTGTSSTDIESRLDQIATDMAKMQDPQSAARPGEVEMVRKSLMNTGLRVQNKTAEQQLANFYKTVEARANNAYSAHGMNPPAQQQQPQYKIVNGIKYMRGPKGEAIPVK